MNFLLSRKISFTVFDNLAAFLLTGPAQFSQIALVAVAHIMVNSWPEDVFNELAQRDEETGEPVVFTFQVNNAPDLEVASQRLNVMLAAFEKH